MLWSGCTFPGAPEKITGATPAAMLLRVKVHTYQKPEYFLSGFRTCRTAMLVEIPCTAKLSVKKPSLLILAECRHIDDSPAKQLAAPPRKTHRQDARTEHSVRQWRTTVVRLGGEMSTRFNSYRSSSSWESWTWTTHDSPGPLVLSLAKKGFSFGFFHNLA